MPNQEKYRWNDIRQIGTDYASVEEVARYDQRMGELRDFEAENTRFLRGAICKANARVADIGCGTARLLRFLSPHIQSGTGYDISPVMLEYARKKAKETNLDNLTFDSGSFLTFAPAPESLDAVCSSLVLHHLPDLWKQVACDNVARALVPGGRFVLMDVVFEFEPNGHDALFRTVLEHAGASYENWIRHIKQEYSTLAWIMRGILERSGFRILEETVLSPFLRFYVAEKQGEKQ